MFGRLVLWNRPQVWVFVFESHGLVSQSLTSFGIVGVFIRMAGQSFLSVRFLDLQKRRKKNQIQLHRRKHLAWYRRAILCIYQISFSIVSAAAISQEKIIIQNIWHNSRLQGAHAFLEELKLQRCFITIDCGHIHRNPEIPASSDPNAAKSRHTLMSDCTRLYAMTSHEPLGMWTARLIGLTMVCFSLDAVYQLTETQSGPGSVSSIHTIRSLLPAQIHSHVLILVSILTDLSTDVSSCSRNPFINTIFCNLDSLWSILMKRCLPGFNMQQQTRENTS